MPSFIEHVLITGTGRAGTTVLARLFTACLFDPGTPTPIIPKIRAGHETPLPLIKGQVPELIKSPALALQIPRLVEEEIVNPDTLHVVVPIRDFRETKESRQKAGVHFWEDQEIELDQVIGRLIESLVLLDIDYTCIGFPNFVYSGAYCWGKLGHLFSRKVTQHRFYEEYDRIVDY